jgi:hypothetical protein
MDRLEKMLTEQIENLTAQLNAAELERDIFRNDNERQTLIIVGLEWGLESFMA